MPVIFLALFVAIIIGAIFNAIAQRKRREGLFELAQRLNLNFDASEDRGIPGRFGFLKQLDQGENRYATNALSGNYQQNEILGSIIITRRTRPIPKAIGKRRTTGFRFSS